MTGSTVAATAPAPASSIQTSAANATKAKAPLYVRAMDRLVEAMTEPALFRVTYAPQHRSTYNEFISSTGMKENEIYSKLTSKFEAATGLVSKGTNTTGPKLYQTSFPLPDSVLSKSAELPLSPEALETLQLMAHFTFFQLRLYDEGQELAEGLLMILLQSHTMDWDDMITVGGAETLVYANARTAPYFLEVILLLSRIYALRFMMVVESRALQGHNPLMLPPWEEDTTGLVAIYDDFMSHVPAKRSRANAIKSTYEIFSIPKEDEQATPANGPVRQRGTSVNHGKQQHEGMTAFVDRPGFSLIKQKLSYDSRAL